MLSGKELHDNTITKSSFLSGGARSLCLCVKCYVSSKKVQIKGNRIFTLYVAIAK